MRRQVAITLSNVAVHSLMRTKVLLDLFVLCLPAQFVVGCEVGRYIVWLGKSSSGDGKWPPSSPPPVTGFQIQPFQLFLVLLYCIDALVPSCLWQRSIVV